MFCILLIGMPTVGGPTVLAQTGILHQALERSSDGSPGGASWWAPGRRPSPGRESGFVTGGVAEWERPPHTRHPRSPVPDHQPPVVRRHPSGSFRVL